MNMDAGTLATLMKNMTTKNNTSSDKKGTIRFYNGGQPDDAAPYRRIINENPPRSSKFEHESYREQRIAVRKILSAKVANRKHSH